MNLTKKKRKNKKIIYIDMDGVLIDSNKIIQKIIRDNVTNSKENITSLLKRLDWKDILNKCNEIENNFTVVKNNLKNYELIVLTHVYSKKESKLKKKYIKSKIKHLKVTSVPYSRDKYHYAKKRNCILIDDYKKNIDKWNENKGIGILYKKQLEYDDNENSSLNIIFENIKKEVNLC